MKLEVGYVSEHNVEAPFVIYVDKELMDQIACVFMKAAKESMDSGKYDTALQILMSMKAVNDMIKERQEKLAKMEAEDAEE